MKKQSKEFKRASAFFAKEVGGEDKAIDPHLIEQAFEEDPGQLEYLSGKTYDNEDCYRTNYLTATFLPFIVTAIASGLYAAKNPDNKWTWLCYTLPIIVPALTTCLSYYFRLRAMDRDTKASTNKVRNRLDKMYRSDLQESTPQ